MRIAKKPASIMECRKGSDCCSSGLSLGGWVLGER